MSGDYSRIGYDPRQNYSVVLLEQGRPLTDRDWNDFALAGARRDQAGMLDALGQVYMSLITPDAFKITGDTAQGLSIGRGRLYLDGLLVENHGSGTIKWDGGLAIEYGSDPTPYLQQPYLHDIKALPTTGGPYVVYLDVWQREVTQFTDPSLLEQALGIDTTTRLQTVWQVKLIDLGAAVTCETALDQKAAWVDATAPSAGRLSITTAAVASVPGDAGASLAVARGRYQGLENQLYRIEIHDGGELGAATFKWSRENASVEARVTRIIDDTHIVVESIGKDDVLRFSDGDWVEIIDDRVELDGSPGQMLRIRVEGGVDESTRVIAFDKALTPDLRPDRHMRIRRWDQNGKVVDKDGHVVVDLSAAGSKGVISAGNVSIHLEEGIVATFSIDAGSQRNRFRTGDYWVFAARTTDASIDPLDKAASRGIHHHYARLAIYTPGSARPDDCRPKSTSDVEGRLLALERTVTPIPDHLTSIDGSITTINTRLQSTEQTVANLKGRVGTLETGLQTVTAKVSTLETGLQGTETDLSTLSTTVTDINTRLATVETKVAEIDGLKTHIKAAEDNITAMKTRLEALERDFPDVKKAALAPRFEAAAAPFDPPKGAVGNDVTIMGRNFNVGTVTVKFRQQASGDLTATSSGATDNSITVKVPNGLQVGVADVLVTNPHATITSRIKFLVTN
jgi:Family of unknown function (DUF6519)